MQAHVAEIGHRLAGEHRVVSETALLRALDLGVPIGALHQPNHEPPVEHTRDVRQPFDHRRRALLVGLHGEAEAVPAGERGIGQHQGDDVERKLKPVGLLGIDGEVEVVALGHAREIERTRHQLGQHPTDRHGLEARMQRGQLDRDAGPRRQRSIAGAPPDGLDRASISVEIACGVGRGARALPEHVERVTELAVRAGARQRFLDGLPEHEMRAEQLHRLARRQSHRRHTKPFHHTLDNILRGFARLDDACGDAQRPGRCRHQEGAGALGLRPIAGGQLVLDQPVGSDGVGHAQQRLGQHHQRQSLLGGERIGVQEILDPAEAARPGANGLDQPAGARVDTRLSSVRARNSRQQTGSDGLVRRRIGCSEGRHRAAPDGVLTDCSSSALREPIRYRL